MVQYDTDSPSLVRLIEDAALGSGEILFLPKGERRTVSSLWEDAGRLAQELDRLRVRTAAVELDNTLESVVALFALLRARVRVMSVPTKADDSNGHGFRPDADLSIFQTATDEPSVVTASAAMVRLQQWRQLETRHEGVDVPPPSELVQFTSGTTGAPKGVRLSHDSIVANCEAMLNRLTPPEPPVAVSWLPLSHDMGLIGMLLTSLLAFSKTRYGRGLLVLMETDEFRIRPYRWLDECGRHKAAVTCAPPSALDMAVAWGRRRSERLDLSHLHALIVGSEPISVVTLSSVRDLLQRAGAPGSAICPAYGCAEMSLGVSMSAPGSFPTIVDDPLGRTELVAAGTALEGVTVDLDVDPVPADLRAAAMGVVKVFGVGLMQGYEGSAEVDEFSTGDLATVTKEGELVPCGRLEDWVQVSGRWIHAPDFEAAAARSLPIRPNRVAAVVIDDALCLGYEPKRGLDLASELAELCRLSTGILADRVVAFSKGTFPLTSSGKLRRAEVKRAILEKSHHGV